MRRTGPRRSPLLIVLVVGNRFDPATRYQGAVAAADLPLWSRLLTLAG